MRKIAVYNAPVQFTVRDYQPADFETLWAIDQSCFGPGIAYSRYELLTYIRRPGAFTLVAESKIAMVSEGFPSGVDARGYTNRVAVGLQTRPKESESTKELAILGFLVAETSRRGIGHVITIDVLAEVRRHRVGSTLLSAAEDKLRTTKSHVARLETAVDNTSALHFYKRHGYDVIRVIPHYYSNGVDALLLEKNLLSVKSAD